MRQRAFGGIGLLLALVVAFLPLVGGGMQRAAAQGGQGLSGDSYESPQFAYTVTWGDAWDARARDVTSNPGGFDTLTLRGAGGTLRIVGQADDVAAAEIVERRAYLESDTEADIVSLDLDAEVPSADLQVGHTTVRIEGYTLPEHGAVVVVVLSARETRFDTALASAQDQVQIDDAPILTGQPIGADVGASPTQTPTPAATSNVTGNTYASPSYGYTFAWDETLWEVSNEMSQGRSDVLQLTSETGLLTMWGWDGYGDDPVACLDGESDFYANDDPGVTNWEPAENARGEPIRRERRDYAYGVFHLTYTNPDNADAEPIDLVDYIECRSIPDQDAVVVIFGSAEPDLYNDHLDNVLDVADTLEFGGAPAGRETPELPVSTPDGATPASGLSGSVFASPSFGFTLDLPSAWKVEDEVLAPNDERLMLTNGVSDVLLWATDDYTGTLEGCIGYVVTSTPLADLKLDVTASGDPFRGSDANGAYANFVYMGADGEQRAFFVTCRYIAEGASVLIMTQDVAYDDYTAQRQARRAIENGITLP